jgi:hypothetical protein
VFDVIEATPDRLREVDGIGPVRAASILAACQARNVSGRRRCSKLSEWLRPKPPVSRQFGTAS